MSTEDPNLADEALDETTSNEKSEDELEKVEIEEEISKDETEVSQNPVPARRGGKKRRRGGRRPTGQDRPQAKKVDQEVAKTDEGEIEVTQNKDNVMNGDESKKDNFEEEDAEEGEEDQDEEREPSPVMTRRSNRRQQQKKDDLPDTYEDINAAEMVTDELKEESNDIVETMDQDEVESVTSELDSIASGSGTGSTLTTRSRRRGGTGPNNATTTKGKKGGRVSKTNAASSNAVNSNSKGKSRRIIFKKSATRAPAAVAKAVTSDRVYYHGQYFTKGDIVSVEDIDDGSVYYAQLRGFLTDQYCEKSGVITWLLPTVNSPPAEESFDASTYVIGPEEELPRKLEYFTFVMHAPDDYFYYRKAPYPTVSIQTDQEYVVTRQGPRVRMTNSERPVYQDIVPPLIPMNVQN